MIKHNKGLYSLLLLCISIVYHSQVYAQTGSVSPYSRFGIGDILSEGFTHQTGMGGIGAAVAEPGLINFINPASYVADSAVVFEFGARGEINQLEGNNESSTRNSASFSYFSLAFPLMKKKAGLAFGLLPFSTVGYDIVVESEEIPDVGVARYKFEGEGGLNKFFVGAGFRIYKGLSAGVNVSYLFGTIQNINSLEFPYNTNYYNSKYINSRTASGLNFNFGLLYEKDLGSDRRLNAGFTFSPSIPVNGLKNQSYYNYILSPYDNEIQKDSVYSEKEEDGTIKMPSYWRAGISYGVKDNWMAGVDFSYHNWENYESFGVEDNLQNSYNIQVGGLKSTSKFVYSLGARYSKTYLELRETRLEDYGITFGWSIRRFAPKKPASMIHLAVEVGKRGTLQDELLLEKYVRLHIGFSLADVWFIKPKYD
jgi:hypothetical protein